MLVLMSLSGLALTCAGTVIVLEEADSNIYEFYLSGALAKKWSFEPLADCTGIRGRDKPKCRFIGVNGQLLVVTDLGESFDCCHWHSHRWRNRRARGA